MVLYDIVLLIVWLFFKHCLALFSPLPTWQPRAEADQSRASCRAQSKVARTTTIGSRQSTPAEEFSRSSSLTGIPPRFLSSLPHSPFQQGGKRFFRLLASCLLVREDISKAEVGEPFYSCFVARSQFLSTGTVGLPRLTKVLCC